MQNKGELDEEKAVFRRTDHQDPVRRRGRRHGISENTFYRWKSKYGGMTVSEAKRLRERDAENQKLKQLLCEAHLDNAALKELLSKNW